ncbi:MAG TPA: bifunctional diguanylate cyclase/phosphodiesterase [Pilimelia sp.]|nr:bifunctional diguanylate cyclase/phosphodiesterase [Pilimelia sp.]
MVLLVIAVSFIVVWASTVTAQAGRAAETATRLADGYQLAGRALTAESLIVYRYRLAPTPLLQAEFYQASDDLRAALRQVRTQGTDADRVVAARIGSWHDRYLVTVGRLFVAVDRSDHGEVRRITTLEAEPLQRELSDTVAAEAKARRADSVRLIRELRELQARTARSVPAVLVSGIVLVAMFFAILRRYRRDAEAQGRQALFDSLHDPLTGLANRRLFSQRLGEAVADGGAGLVLLDLDRFREINEALGQGSGDRLLVQVGRWLQAATGPGDTVGRLGGDEFAVLLRGVRYPAEAVAAAERLRRATEQLIRLDSVDLSVEISAGVALSGLHGQEAGTLLQRAEVAMYTAKHRNSGVALFEPGAEVHDAERLAMLGELRRAIDQGDLELHYQPKVSMATGQACGVEALVRWPHPTLGMVSPDRFVPMAEHTALMGPLTALVLRGALAQARRWIDAGTPLPVSVNLSARNLADPQLDHTVGQLLEEYDVPPEMLTLELTESAIITEPEHARRLLRRLRAAGVGLAIDDFGAGYTSLGQLKTLAVTELKIDQSFVAAMTTEPSAGVIVRGLIELAANLGLSTTAEGVEDAETYRRLQLYGCVAAQGFLMARPMRAEELDQWLAGRVRRLRVA